MVVLALQKLQQLNLQQQAALLARGARRHDSRKSEVSAVAEDLLNASHYSQILHPEVTQPSQP